METADKSGKKLWLPSWKGVIITLLVGSNIILIRVIGALVYKGQYLEYNITKQSEMNRTQSPRDQLYKEETKCIAVIKEIQEQLCVNSNGELRGCMLCPDGWLRHRESCYYFSSGKEHRTWNGSRDMCVKMGAHLLVIENWEQKENEKQKKMKRKKRKRKRRKMCTDACTSYV